MEDPPGNGLLRLLRHASRGNLRQRHPQSLGDREQKPLGRDVTLAEDASRIRVNPGIMARLRSNALNIARANGATNIADALWTAALDPAVSLSYTGL